VEVNPIRSPRRLKSASTDYILGEGGGEGEDEECWNSAGISSGMFKANTFSFPYLGEMPLMRNLRRFIRSEGESTALSLSRSVFLPPLSLSLSLGHPGNTQAAVARYRHRLVLRFIVDHVNHRNPARSRKRRSNCYSTRFRDSRGIRGEDASTARTERARERERVDGIAAAPRWLESYSAHRAN